jgi:hypothetical protein
MSLRLTTSAALLAWIPMEGKLANRPA